MKKLALALMFCGASAFAGTVDYSTSGAFGSNGATSITVGSSTIAFTGESPTYVTSTGSYAQVGTFTVTGGAVPANFSDSFTLTINQTSPAGTGSTSTAVDGEIEGSGSTILLSFTPSSLDINGANWVFGTTPIAAPSNTANGITAGTTTLTEYVSTPEPASLGLIGSSLVGLGLAFRRRLAK